jgi:transcriptional regulator with XRE-family HTH domain
VESLEEWLTQPEGLATGLKTLRRQAGLTGKQLATDTGWDQSKISRIEHGDRIPPIADIQAWARACGASEDETAALLARRTAALSWQVAFQARKGSDVQNNHNRLADQSTLIRYFDNTYIPGILQVPGYARAVLTAHRKRLGLPMNDLDEAVAARMERARMVHEPTRRFEVILAEPVLRWLLCPPEIMRAQLHSLHGVIGLEWVRFGIIPMGAPIEYAPESSVQIYAGKQTVAVTEDFRDETFHHDEAAAVFSQALDLLWGEAVEGEAARELIAPALRALPA